MTKNEDKNRKIAKNARISSTFFPIFLTNLIKSAFLGKFFENLSGAAPMESKHEKIDVAKVHNININTTCCVDVQHVVTS